ncbi:EAL domain-containing protein [Alicyclobacillus tolerans]|uniref:EAL domain-containing protein n=1 Tax=Alicyclobacillus tolerans TaxID=90970 RepID=UPI001F17C364|nr:EAL domain-containing protein [Alicyclobacillus tolerans]MCF8568241.1 EAL domain-containing protein [Alicyclobacillus tolerans]
MHRIAYQPIWDLVQHEIIAYEALMRPKDGRTPTEVLSQYRDANQVVSLDQGLIQQAMHDARPLLEEGQLLMANVEPETLHETVFWESWAFPLAVPQVVLEITERASLEVLHLDTFHGMGVSLALDDFGTGMSNLIALERIQPAWVKMGREFLSEHNQLGILSSMVTYCDRMNIKLIVEGIEELSDVAFLQDIDVRYAQGFYLGKPKFADEYEKGSGNTYVAYWN